MRISSMEVVEVDEEWYALIVEARKLGLSLDMVRGFLDQSREKMNT